jgi:hypothetical protein
MRIITAEIYRSFLLDAKKSEVAEPYRIAY